MIKRLLVVATVWAMCLAWALTSVVLPSDSASAAATTAGGRTNAQVSGGPSAAAVLPSAARVRHHMTARLCSTVNQPGRVRCFAIRQTDTVQPAGVSENAVSPQVAPAGYGPSTLAAAYSLDQSKGSGQTVAIVDAYDDPSAESDLAAYRTQYGLPSCTTASGCFKKVSQSGSSTLLPLPDADWAGEISLDLDMVSATCPNCHILLVEATGPDVTDLGTSVSARLLHPVDRFVWNQGLAMLVEQPEPVPWAGSEFHAVSVHPRALLAVLSEVPPTAVTYAPVAGYCAP